jgi:hypothetical protein
MVEYSRAWELSYHAIRKLIFSDEPLQKRLERALNEFIWLGELPEGKLKDLYNKIQSTWQSVEDFDKDVGQIPTAARRMTSEEATNTAELIFDFFVGVCGKR